MAYKVLDGGLATEIAWAHGHKYIDDDPLWSARLLATDPELIKTVHKSFLESGADIIETASYQASIEGFMEHLSVGQAEAFALIQKSGQLAKEVVEEYWKHNKSLPDNEGRCKPIVAGSLGPYGACQHDASEYTGSYVDSMDVEELKSWHRPHIEALIASGVDILAFDTIPAQKEALAIAEILKEFESVKAWISLSCKNTSQICHGEKFCDVASSLLPFEQISGIGINCCPPDIVSDLLRTLPKVVKQSKNIIVYPNSGETWVKEDGWTGKRHTKPLHLYVPEWIDLEANWIGGCCRVSPSDIKEISKAIRKIKS